MEELHKLASLLKLEYPEMYSLAWKLLTKVMERRLNLPVYPAEVGYLTVHLQRLNQRKEEEEVKIITMHGDSVRRIFV